MFYNEVKGAVEGFLGGVTGLVKSFVKDPTEALKAEAEITKLSIQLQSDMLKLEVSDRDSARKREMEVKDSTPSILAYSVTAGFFGLLGYMMVGTIPHANERILDLMLGSLGTVWVMQMSYYYGTSTGSQLKDKFIGAFFKNGNGNGTKVS